MSEECLSALAKSDEEVLSLLLSDTFLAFFLGLLQALDAALKTKQPYKPIQKNISSTENINTQIRLFFALEKDVVAILAREFLFCFASRPLVAVFSYVI